MSADRPPRRDTPPFADVDALFARARRAPAVERAALLASAPATLRAEVKALLAAHDADDGAFLAAPALGRDFRLAELAAAPAPLPERVGPYRVRGLLGEGGMGRVLRAEHGDPPRAVALKLLHPGATNPALRRRFAREAEALGRLDHPGIARVHDAGLSADGVPFLAMELVEGRPLLAFADAEGLDQRARLELFAKLCDAVAHAHAQGVVHRDLKPANVLVTRGTHGGGPQPKVLDFGIARLTDADLQRTTLATSEGQLLGTLPYMSPEQAAGDVSAVNARSDVWALGALLFELLTGALPHDLRGKPLPVAVQTLRDDEPRALAGVDPTLAGPLDTVAGTALQRDPARRYPSAAALADDVRRHLAGAPLLAQPPSTLDQLRRRARRHRAQLTLAGAVALALLAGLVAVLLQWGQTRAARDLAEQRSDDLQLLVDELLREVDGRLLHVGGALPARRAMVQTALRHLEPLTAGAGDDPELLATLVRAFARVGDIQGLPGVPNLGLADGARESWETALELLDRLESARGPCPADELERHNLLARLGDLDRAEGRAASALAHYERAQDAWRRGQAARPDAAERPLPLRPRVADLLRALGRPEEAAAERARASEEARRWAAAHPDDWNAQRDVAVALMKRAIAAESSDPEAALADYADYIARVEALLEAQPLHAVLRRDLAVGHGRRADLLRALGRRVEADAHHVEASRLHEALLAAAPDDAQALKDLCMSVNRSGELALADGEPRAALPHFERFLELSAALVARDDARPDYLRRRGVALYKLGEVHAALGALHDLPRAARREHWNTAADWFARCLAHFTDMHARGLLADADAGVPDEVRAQLDACSEAAGEL